MVLTTVGASALFSLADVPPDVEAVLHDAWRTLSDDGRRSLVVRSSSTVEDAASGSMAGQFTSVLDVHGWPELLEAVCTVLDSATNPALSDAPMAVLVQPFLAAARGGVLFGADPVTGNADHLVVAAIEGGPDQLGGGTVDGTTTTLTRRGRYLAGEAIDRRSRRRLARLAAKTEAVFGGPQDMEWAVDTDDRLWLLQSRPITTPVHQPTGPRFGPGPVAETFPTALAPLEVDLWVDPLRRGLREALRLSATASPRRLRRSPVVVVAGGQVAVDLDLFEPPRRNGLLHLVDPRPGARRLRAAWRVGRLRAALPDLAGDLVDDIDAELLKVPALPELTIPQLLGVLRTTKVALASLHGYEALAGLLLDVQTPSVTGASVALQALAEGRATGLDDVAIIQRDPVVLALVPPRIGPLQTLPAAPSAVNTPPPGPQNELDAASVSREALRVRARWVQELGAAAAGELGRRLAEVGRLEDGDLVRWLSLDELIAMLVGVPAPADLPARRMVNPAPLPAAFRLATDGHVVPASRLPARRPAQAVAASTVRSTSGPTRRRGPSSWSGPWIPPLPRSCPGWPGWWPRPAVP